MKHAKYLIVPEFIEKDKFLPELTKRLLANILSFHMNYGSCICSNRYFAEFFNKSERTIQRSIATLRNHGYINVSYDKRSYRKIKISQQWYGHCSELVYLGSTEFGPYEP